MAKSEAEKAADERREELRKANEEAQKRMDESVPTPTQEELDRMKLGIVEPEKKDEPAEREAKPASSGAGYQTRAKG